MLLDCNRTKSMMVVFSFELWPTSHPTLARINVCVILNASEMFANNSLTQKSIRNQSVEVSA